MYSSLVCVRFCLVCMQCTLFLDNPIISMISTVEMILDRYTHPL